MLEFNINVSFSIIKLDIKLRKVSRIKDNFKK